MTQARSSRPFLQAALNGDRVHPAVPHTPAQIAAEALAAVNAGAQSVHAHPFDDDGRQTLAAEPCAATIRAVRAACPRISISLTTSADVEPNPQRRMALVEAWTETPDLVTANQGEEQVDHGEGIASWAVNRRAILRRHGIRTGLEDTPILPDGRMAHGNGDLVAAAAAMLARNGPQ
jgi:uncharacterized protein (DUF849 family)